MRSISKLRFLALLALCVALNLGIGLLVAVVKLPLYLDSIGTVLASAVGGLWAGVICGLCSSIVASAYTPTQWAYAGTMLAIASYVILTRPLGYLNKLLPTALFGLGLGIVCAIVSAPVTTYLWKGVSQSGTDSVAAFFSSQGWSPLLSVILGSLCTDPIDKLLTSLVAFALLKRSSSRFFP
jgi:energy-coupling factor transport system substrate-specific component